MVERDGCDPAPEVETGHYVYHVSILLQFRRVQNEQRSGPMS